MKNIWNMLIVMTTSNYLKLHKIVLTFLRGNSAALFVNKSDLMFLLTKTNHFHVCYSKLLKRSWRFTIWTILDLPMITKDSPVSKCIKVTQMHSLGDNYRLSQLDFLFASMLGYFG